MTSAIANPFRACKSVNEVADAMKTIFEGLKDPKMVANIGQLAKTRASRVVKRDKLSLAKTTRLEDAKRAAMSSLMGEFVPKTKGSKKTRKNTPHKNYGLWKNCTMTSVIATLAYEGGNLNEIAAIATDLFGVAPHPSTLLAQRDRGVAHRNNIHWMGGNHTILGESLRKELADMLTEHRAVYST